jgi:hypothetical protein
MILPDGPSGRIPAETELACGGGILCIEIGEVRIHKIAHLILRRAISTRAQGLCLQGGLVSNARSHRIRGCGWNRKSSGERTDIASVGSIDRSVIQSQSEEIERVGIGRGCEDKRGNNRSDSESAYELAYQGN